MPRKDKNIVRPAPILSVSGTFTPIGGDSISDGWAIRPDQLSVSVEGSVVYLNEGVLYPVSPGDHHVKRRRDRDWRDLL